MGVVLAHELRPERGTRSSTRDAGTPSTLVVAAELSISCLWRHQMSRVFAAAEFFPA